MCTGLLYWTALGLRLPGLYQSEHCQCVAPPGAGTRIILQAGVRGGVRTCTVERLPSGVLRTYDVLGPALSVFVFV